MSLDDREARGNPREFYCEHPDSLEPFCLRRPVDEESTLQSCGDFELENQYDDGSKWGRSVAGLRERESSRIGFLPLQYYRLADC